MKAAILPNEMGLIFDPAHVEKTHDRNGDDGDWSRGDARIWIVDAASPPPPPPRAASDPTASPPIPLARRLLVSARERKRERGGSGGKPKTLARVVVVVVAGGEMSAAVNEETSVYVGGLPYEANEDMLRDAFGRFGTIVSVKVPFPTSHAARPPPLSRPALPSQGFAALRSFSC